MDCAELDLVCCDERSTHSVWITRRFPGLARFKLAGERPLIAVRSGGSQGMPVLPARESGFRLPVSSFTVTMIVPR